HGFVDAVEALAHLEHEQRHQQHLADEAMRYELQTRGETVMASLGQDFNNLVTADDAGEMGLTPAGCLIERHSDGVVKSFQCPGMIETEPGNKEPGTVRYWTQPAGRSYTVGDSVLTAYVLHRDINTVLGADTQPVAETVVGFDVTLFGASGAPVTDGAAPDDLYALQLHVELASDGAAAFASDQTSERQINLARFGHTVRPPNLTYLERSASGGFVTGSSPGSSPTTTWESGGSSGGDSDD
ncbi:MAG: hypothetical protein AAFX41_04670, partial [Bacteroidota bacterium]